MRNIKGFEDLYQVSETGIIKSLERRVKMPNGGYKIIKEHYPKLSVTKKGYLKVMLTDKKGVRRGKFVHRLVALNFIKESELQVNHIDSNKQNNNVSNLEFVTQSENMKHRFLNTQTSSKYTGVTWHKRNKKWQAQKLINGNVKYLGQFDIEEQARNKYLES